MPNLQQNWIIVFQCVTNTVVICSIARTVNKYSLKYTEFKQEIHLYVHTRAHTHLEDKLNQTRYTILCINNKKNVEF